MALSKDLSRDKVVDTALAILRKHGLAALSMRQVAASLGVQPSALYWHVESKQELLAQIADRILTKSATTRSSLPTEERIKKQAVDIRTALLTVRDGAEVVSFAQAFRPLENSPARTLHRTLQVIVPEPAAEWGAQTLAHYILGEVAEEQNYAELTRAGIRSGDHSLAPSVERFLFGVQAIFDGLTHPNRPAPKERRA